MDSPAAGHFYHDQPSFSEISESSGGPSCRKSAQSAREWLAAGGPGRDQEEGPKAASKGSGDHGRGFQRPAAAAIRRTPLAAPRASGKKGRPAPSAWESRQSAFYSAVQYEPVFHRDIHAIGLNTMMAESPQSAWLLNQQLHWQEMQLIEELRQMQERHYAEVRTLSAFWLMALG